MFYPEYNLYDLFSPFISFSQGFSVMDIGLALRDGMASNLLNREFTVSGSYSHTEDKDDVNGNGNTMIQKMLILIGKGTIYPEDPKYETTLHIALKPQIAGGNEWKGAIEIYKCSGKIFIQNILNIIFLTIP